MNSETEPRLKTCAAPCISRIGEMNGKAFVVYLRDGTKITVGRGKGTKGPAWLEVAKQLEVKAQRMMKASDERT